MLVELPELPAVDSWNQFFRHAGNITGANRMLKGERTDFWPGHFQYEQRPYAQRFSLGGAIWLFTFLAALNFLRPSFWRNQARGLASTWLLMFVLTAAILCGVRWMAHSGLPERFLITPYAAGIVVAAAMTEPLLHRSRLVQTVALLLVTFSIYAGIRQPIQTAAARYLNPPSISTIDAPFTDALRLIPPGSKILLFGNHLAPDYPLFAPRQGFANQVYPWGKRPIEREPLRHLIAEKQITHLVFQDARVLPFEWAPEVWVDRAWPWLLEEKDLKLILGTGETRVFATSRAKTIVNPNDASQRMDKVPQGTPLVFVAPELQTHVGLDENEVTTPWAIERLNSNGYLWIGSGETSGIAFGVWSDQARAATIQMDLEPGPARQDLGRTIVVDSLEGKKEACRMAFNNRQVIECRVELAAGHNNLHIWSPDKPTVKAQPNGDTRPLIMGLYRASLAPTKR